MRKILAPRPLAAVVAAGAVVAAAAAALLVPSHAGDGRPEVPPLLVVEAQGLRYEFHLPTGTEALFDTAADEQGLRNVLEDRPADARRMRAMLSRRHRVPDVEELREHYRETADTLRGLGYL